MLTWKRRLSGSKWIERGRGVQSNPLVGPTSVRPFSGLKSRICQVQKGSRLSARKGHPVCKVNFYWKKLWALHPVECKEEGGHSISLGRYLCLYNLVLLPCFSPHLTPNSLSFFLLSPQFSPFSGTSQFQLPPDPT